MKFFLTQCLKPRFNFLEVLLVTLLIVFASLSAVSWVINLAFQTPLPSVRVRAANGTAPTYRKDYRFTEDWFSHNIPVWEVVLDEFKGGKKLQYLEIGAYEGRSLLWVLENVLMHPSSKLVAVDPFDGPYRERYFANIKLSGAPEQVTSITGYSQVALRQLPLESFDIIYIDGSHAKSDGLEDAVLSWRLLKPGGLLIFDDYQWAGWQVRGTSDHLTDFPKIAIDAFIQCFDEQLEIVHNDYQVIVRKRQSKRNP